MRAGEEAILVDEIYVETKTDGERFVLVCAWKINKTDFSKKKKNKNEEIFLHEWWMKNECIN